MGPRHGPCAAALEGLIDPKFEVLDRVRDVPSEAYAADSDGPAQIWTDSLREKRHGPRGFLRGPLAPEPE